MRRIILTKEEKQSLEHLHKTSSNSVVRGRCLCLLLSHRGSSMAAVSRQTETNWQRIVRLFNAWESATPENKFSVLSIASGRGAKIKLEPFANEVKELLETHNRNVKPILENLQTNHGIKVSKMTLLNFLKASGL